MTSKSTNDEINNDIHDKLLLEFLVYLRWSQRFEQFGYKESAVKSRNALMNMRRLAQARYQEIQAKKIALHGNQNEGDEEAADDN